jgi:DNA-binding NarL/FixJ family response regulator
MAVDTLLAPPPSEDSPWPDDLSEQPVHRVVVVDPRLERRALTSLFVERCGPLTVVGLAAGLEEAETQIRAEHADVALVEIQMPVAEGLATIAALRAQFPELRIVVCSFHQEPATRDAARTQGADGYLTKPLDVAELLALV